MSVKIATDQGEQKAIDDIREYGLHIISVAEDETGPGFAYSIGLFENYAHPEVIIIGLRQSLAHTLLNNMASDIKAGKTFTPGEFHEDVAFAKARVGDEKAEAARIELEHARHLAVLGVGERRQAQGEGRLAAEGAHAT